MPYKDPEKRRAAARLGMRNMRAKEKGLTKKVNPNDVTPVNPTSSPINSSPTNNGHTGERISLVAGDFEGLNGVYWSGICPVCNFRNKMDQKRSYRPFEKCEHFVRLEKSGQPSQFVFKSGLTKKVNPNVTPVNPSTLSNLGILYRKEKDDFTLVYLTGDKIRPLRSIRTGMENSIPELSGLRILRDKGGNKKEEKK